MRLCVRDGVRHAHYCWQYMDQQLMQVYWKELTRDCVWIEQYLYTRIQRHCFFSKPFWRRKAMFDYSSKLAINVLISFWLLWLLSSVSLNEFIGVPQQRCCQSSTAWCLVKPESEGPAGRAWLWVDPWTKKLLGGAFANSWWPPMLKDGSSFGIVIVSYV